MFDVGANVGMYSIWAAATKGINVIAIEPESQNYAVLNKNILLNNLKDKVTALCFAMSDEEKISELNLRRLEVLKKIPASSDRFAVS